MQGNTQFFLHFFSAQFINLMNLLISEYLKIYKSLKTFLSFMYYLYNKYMQIHEFNKWHFWKHVNSDYWLNLRFLNI